jgi:hypothetical protein
VNDRTTESRLKIVMPPNSLVFFSSFYNLGAQILKTHYRCSYNAKTNFYLKLVSRHSHLVFLETSFKNYLLKLVLKKLEWIQTWPYDPNAKMSGESIKSRVFLLLYSPTNLRSAFEKGM